QSSLTAAITRLTPIPDRLRVRTNGNAAASSSVSVAKKRGRISENEENDENNDDTSVLHELLIANAVATQNCTKVDYDVTTLGARQQTQKRTLATVVATTITSTASSLSSNRHSTGSEDSVNTGSQQSSLTAATTRLTPMPDCLRIRTNGNAAASSSSSLS
ncbi:unnamed protein product, partial [Rotaria sp. Silwood2]